MKTKIVKQLLPFSISLLFFFCVFFVNHSQAQTEFGWNDKDNFVVENESNEIHSLFDKIDGDDPLKLIFKGERLFFNYLHNKDRVDALIQFVEKGNLVAKKKKNLKFRLCLTGVTLANLDTDYYEREESYLFCAHWAQIKTPLMPADIEDVYHKFPQKELISQVLDDQGNPRPELIKLCHLNPLGKKVFVLPPPPTSSGSALASSPEHDKKENNYYCTLNLGFRACNLLIQKIKPELSRLEAFHYCTQDKRTRFPLSTSQKSEYITQLPHYLSVQKR